VRQKNCRDAQLAQRFSERGSLPADQFGEAITWFRELPRRAIGGKRLEAALAGVAAMPAPQPAVGFGVESSAGCGEGLDPTISIAVRDLVGNVERLANVEATRGSPSQRCDEEQVHVRIIETVASGEAPGWMRRCVRDESCFAAFGCHLLHGHVSPVSRSIWPAA
jgi:hypothetical protein